MPQLDLSLFPSQILWLAISFFALYMVMHFVVVPKIEHISNVRKTEISGGESDINSADSLLLSISQEKERITLENRNAIDAIYGAKMSEFLAQKHEKMKQFDEKYKQLQLKQDEAMTEAKAHFEKMEESVVLEASSILLHKMLHTTPSLDILKKSYNSNPAKNDGKK